jgi:hypothetical protein
VADRDLHVKITGDSSSLDTAADQADKRVAGFAGSVGELARRFGALITGVAVAAFFKAAVEEAAAAEKGIARLGVAVENAGGDFEAMRPEIEATVTSVQRLTRYTDDDLREALTRLVAISGDTKASLANLNLVTDLAAFKQIDLSSAADIVAKAMNGNTTALNKMGIAGKDATTVLDNARASFGGFAEKEASTLSGTLIRIANQWGEVKEAVGKAIVGTDGAKDSTKGVLGQLVKLEEWITAHEGDIGSLASRFFDLGIEIVSAGRALASLPGLGPVLGGLFRALEVSLLGLTFSLKAIGAGIEEFVGQALLAFGLLVRTTGVLWKVLGVDIVKDTGDAMVAAGKALTEGSKTQLAEARRVLVAGYTDVTMDRKVLHATIEVEDFAHNTRTTKIAHDGGKGRVDASKEWGKKLLDYERELASDREKALKDANKVLEDTAGKLSLAATATKKEWKEINDRALAATKKIVLAKDATEQLAGATEGVRGKAQKVLDTASATKTKLDDQVDSAVSLGLSFLGLAETTGKIDEHAASALTSVVNMASSIAKFGIGSPEGILSIVNGLANLIGGWGSSAVHQAQKAAQMRNTLAIEELTRDLSDYNGATSGRTFSGVTSALGSVLDQFDRNNLSAKDIQKFTKMIEPALAAAGVTSGDVKKLAEKYGIDLSQATGWFDLLEILRSRKFGTPTGNFTDELASLTETFDVLGVDDEDDRLKAFKDFADKNIPILGAALGDLSTKAGRDQAIAKIKQLYTDSLTPGKLLPADFGKATPQQFRSLIGTLLPLLGSADGTYANKQLVTPSVPPVPVGGTLPGSGVSVSGAPGTSSILGLLPGGGRGLDTVGPPLIGGGSLGVPSMLTTINGGLTIVNNWPDILNSREAAEFAAQRVAEILGQDYVRQREALGIAS